MPKQYLYLIIITIILISALILRITDNSGKWVCVEGQWLKEGRTRQTIPQEPCIDFKNIHNFNTCSQLDNFIWCSEIEKCIASTLSCSIFLEVDELSKNIDVLQPLEGELMSSPYEVRGLAPGTWYFEANFEIQLLDESGNIITRSIATAQSDWMTTSQVPFVAYLEFETNYQGPAKLLLIKDNPSGLEEYEDFYELDISI